MRPMLRPGLRHVWLSPDTLQVGVDVPNPLVVPGLPVLAHALLSRLDGVRGRTELIAGLVRDGLDPSEGRQSEEVLDRLAEMGALVDGNEWGADLRRGLLATHVTILGAGRLGGIVARAVAEAGVGCVAVDDDRVVTPADLAPGGYTPDQIGERRWVLSRDHRPRPLTEALRRIVVVTDEADISTECSTLNREGLPHLVVSCREMLGHVGPFVVPGQTSCQLCLELSRRDRDPRYAVVWRQSRRQPLPECEPLLAAVTAHIAASHVISWAAGRTPPSMDAVLDVLAPDASVRRQHTLPHPECGCAWPGSAA